MDKRKITIRVLTILAMVFLALAVNEYVKYKASDAIYKEARLQYYEEKEGFLKDIEEQNIEDVLNDQSNQNEESQDVTETTFDDSEETSIEASVKTEATTKKVEPVTPVVDKATASKEGSVIGWITIEGTKIDYPVTQTTDNDFYLTHNYLGKKDVKGSIYMDFRNLWDKGDRNYILYGHKMIDGTMFSDLAFYVQEGSYKNYFNNYNIIKYDDFVSVTEWKIFSAYVVNLNKEEYYLYTKYRDDEDYLAFIDEIKRRSILKSDEEISIDDEMITLVTCNFWYDNARVIIHAVRQ